LSPEYFALLVALVTYTSAFIAEIVRSGIQAVHKGQWDAAMALGLRRSFVLQHIVMPQALRVIIPPMTSQYLNLTKEFLAGRRGRLSRHCVDCEYHAEPTGQAIEAIALIMAVFLTISLGISFFMNWYNRRNRAGGALIMTSVTDAPENPFPFGRSRSRRLAVTA